MSRLVTSERTVSAIMTTPHPRIYLGTVLLERNRWTPDRIPTFKVSEWAASIRAAGFDGVILQGMCTYAWLAEACAEYLGDPARLRRLRVRFSRPPTRDTEASARSPLAMPSKGSPA